MSARRWHGAILVVLVLGVVSCKKPITAELERPVDIHVGQAARFANSDLELLFQRVTSDSRCPRNVQCVWAGEAVVRLRGRRGNGDPESFEARLSDKSAPSDTSIAAQFGGHWIWLIRLAPYPVAGTAADTTAYVATFVVRQR